MDLFQASILGLLQGLAEFLPISSSGHLAVVPFIFGWTEQPLVFDTTMHLATALALVVYFWQDLWQMGWSLIRDIFTQRLQFKKYRKESMLALYIGLSTIPASIAGLLIGDYIEFHFRNAEYVILFLTLGSILMVAAELVYARKNHKATGEEKPENPNVKTLNQELASLISLKKSLIIGTVQCLPLFPGFSRSGSTLSAGMILGLTREQATRFSFLMSVPIVAAAGFFKLVQSADVVSTLSFEPIILGFLISFGSGLLAIGFLLKFVKSNSLWVFIAYRVVLTIFLGILVLN